MSVDEKMINRIKGLLAKAESTSNEAEADAFFSKAQELMMKHAVDEAMLKAAGKKTAREEIVTRTIKIRSWIHEVQGSFLTGLAPILNCRIYRSGYNVGNRREYYIVGFESDAVFCEMLFASIAAQAWRAGLHEGHAGRDRIPCEDCNGTGFNYLAFEEGKEVGDLTDDEKDLYRCQYCKGKGYKQKSKTVAAKSFLDGYFARVLIRARERYIRMEESVGTSTALALRDKGDQVAQWMKDNLSLGHGKASRRRQWDGAAYSAGHRAGERADISGGRNTVKGGEKKSLPE